MADPPGSDPPGSDPPPSSGGRSAADRVIARIESGFERILALTRLAVLAPVIVLALSGMGAFAYGTDVFVTAVPDVIARPRPVSNKVGLFLIEIDLFLVGATLIIAAFGFYELFISKIDPVDRRHRLPAWLEMRDLNDLKARVIAMLILVAAVTFVEVVLDLHDVLGTLYLGGAVALVIAALTVYLRFGSERGPGA